MENTFGILASKFQVLQTIMQQESGVVMWMVTACVVLHKLLRMGSGRGQFQVDNMGLNLGKVLKGKWMPYQEEIPVKLSRHSELITSGTKELCLNR